MSISQSQETQLPPPPVLPAALPLPPVPPFAPVPVVLRADSLSKRFKSPDGSEKSAATAASAAPEGQGQLEVLRNISLAVNAGEFVSIQGASGAGKTTLLQILGGLDQPDDGQLFWNGELITGRGNAFLARRRALWLGYVFQSYHLIPELNALENVILAGRIAGRPLREVEAQARELLGQVGLTARLRHLPSKLSGGECQRVAIARALVNRPSVLLADEPTGNLDEATGEKIMELLIALTKAERVALVLVTHNPVFATRATRRYHLSCGVLREELETR